MPQAIQNIRSLMEAGKLNEARAAESTLIAWLNRDKHECIPGPASLSKPGFEARKANFVCPFSICSEEVLDKTIGYARTKNPVRSISLSNGYGVTNSNFIVNASHAHRSRHQVPKGVNFEVLNEIRCFARNFENTVEDVEESLLRVRRPGRRE